VTSSTSGLRRSFCSSRCPCGCPSVCRRPGQAVSTRRSHNSSIVGGGWVRHDSSIVNCRSTDSERPHHRCCQLPNNCVSRQMFPTLHDGLENFSPPQKLSFPLGRSAPVPTNHMVFWANRSPNGLSIGSAVLAQLTVMSKKLTQRDLCCGSFAPVQSYNETLWMSPFLFRPRATSTLCFKNASVLFLA